MAKVARARKKKRAGSRAKRVGPRVKINDLIATAVSASRERKGISFANLRKALAAGGYDVNRNKARVKTVIKSLVAKGTLVQTKGSGASGSFKMSQKAKRKPRRKATARKTGKARKRAVSKRRPATRKRSTAKKRTAAKKPGARKSPKKARKRATPRRPAKSRKRVARKAPAAKRSRARKAPRRKLRRASARK